MVPKHQVPKEDNMSKLHHLSPRALSGLAAHAQEVADYCINQSALAVDEVDRQMYWDRAMSEQREANKYKAALALQ